MSLANMVEDEMGVGWVTTVQTTHPQPATSQVRKRVVPMPMRWVSVLPKKVPPARVRRHDPGAEPSGPHTDAGMALSVESGHEGPPATR